jgi:hypothetical protein
MDVFLGWSVDQSVGPLTAAGPPPAFNVSRRLSVVAGFYCVCVIDRRSCRIHPPTTSDARWYHPSHPPSVWDTCSSKP